MLLGASCLPQPGDRILDLCAGCGIVGLMIARRFPSVHLTGIELDEDACTECNENIVANKLEDRALCINADVVQWAGETPLKYDFIVSNPPYFQNDLLPDNDRLNKAKHAGELTLHKLVESSASLLKEKGKFAVIIPAHLYPALLIECRKNDLVLLESTGVKSLADNEVIRQISIFVKTVLPQKPTIKTMVIQRSTVRNDWSDDYKSLLRDFKNFL